MAPTFFKTSALLKRCLLYKSRSALPPKHFFFNLTTLILTDLEKECQKQVYSKMHVFIKMTKWLESFLKILFNDFLSHQNVVGLPRCCSVSRVWYKF
jgi:hypothetical protein